MKARSGIITLDAIIGLAAIGVLLGALTVATARYTRTREHLLGARTATRLCQGALADLADGRAPAAQGPVSWRRLDTAAPPGRVWVEVSAQVDGGRGQLVGLVPAGSLPAGGVP